MKYTPNHSNDFRKDKYYLVSLGVDRIDGEDKDYWCVCGGPYDSQETAVDACSKWCCHHAYRCCVVKTVFEG